MIFKDVRSKHDERLGMKLCDFGTSLFSGQEFSERRHWQIVEETVMRLSENFPDRSAALAAYAEYRKMGSANVLRTGPLRDYLSFWEMHRFPPEYMTVSRQKRL